MEETAKVIVAHFSYNKNLDQKINFQSHIVKTENVLRLWYMRNKTNQVKALVFKSLNL